MSARRPSLAAVGATVCAAVGLWVSFGTIAFTDVTGGAVHYGLLPASAWLAASVLVALGALVITKPPATRLAPLWLSAVLILPWLPLNVPLSVFIWTGALRLWLWTAIALAVIGPSAFAQIRSRVHPSPTQSAVLAGCVSALVYSATAYLDAKQHPGGDEPHYLVITQSLLKDHDLKIENNHRQEDYLVYYGAPLSPDFVRRGVNRAIYSIHAPGLPVLVAPAFALGGYDGVLIELIALSACGGALAWLLAWRVTNDFSASWFGWAGAALSAPVVLHASAVYPEAPAAVIVLLAALAVVDARARRAPRLLYLGAALAVLPWLHSRYTALAAAAAFVVVVRVLSDRASIPSRLAALLALPTISAAGWFAYFWVIYGSPLPSAPYGPSLNTAVGNIVRGIPGLLADQQYGVIAHAPVLLCGLLGLGTLFARQRGRLGLDLLILATPYCVLVACFQMWWGGYSAPARFLVPVTLLASMPLAYWFSTRQTPAARVAGLAALYASLAISTTMVVVDRGWLSVNLRSGTSRLFEWVSPNVDLTTALPSLFQTSLPAMLQYAAMWAVLAIAATAAAMIVNRRWPASDVPAQFARAALVLGLVVEYGATGVVSLIWQENRALPARPDVSAWALLRAYEAGSGQIALSYAPFGRVRLPDLPPELPLTRPVPGTENQWSAMARLPPGTYEVTGRVADRHDGVVRMAIDSKGSKLVEWPVATLEPTWSRRFTIPVTMPALLVDFDTAARQNVHDISVRAVSLLPLARRLPGNPEAARAVRYGSSVVYWTGGSAWLEDAGLWVEGGSSAQFAIAPDTPGPSTLFVHNGATANTVTIDIAGTRKTLTMPPGNEQLVALPAMPEGTAVPLSVSASSGFQPSAVERGNPDARFLGVWLETR